MSKFKIFKELFGALYVCTFLRKIPYSKLFEEMFCFSFDIFHEGGGGGVYLISKLPRKFYAL